MYVYLAGLRHLCRPAQADLPPSMKTNDPSRKVPFMKSTGFGSLSSAMTVTGMLGATFIGVSSIPQLSAQESTDYLTPYRPAELTDKDISFGDLSLDLGGRIGATYFDNLALSDNGNTDDFAIEAGLNVRSFYQPMRDFALSLDLLIGYQHYLDFDELNTLLIQPGSEFRIERRFSDFKVSVYDRLGVEMNPLSRPYVSGDPTTLGTDQALEWRFLRNTAGTGLTWQPQRQFHTQSNYEFALDRSLTDSFKNQNRDRHTIKSGAYYDFTRQLNAGVEGQYVATRYSESGVTNAQNDSDGFEVGPTVRYQFNRSLDISGKAAYQSINYDQTGNIGSLEDFDGINYRVDVNYRPSRNFTHSLFGQRLVDDGFGTNFADQTMVGYLLVTSLPQEVTASFNATYIWLDTSTGPLAEQATITQAGINLSKALSRKANLGVTYTLNLKDSEVTLRDFQQNVISVFLNYDF